ncbi:PD40 domain-containing protein [bacterium]|nr:PD40 domain-containing protein [bacterium]
MKCHFRLISLMLVFSFILPSFVYAQYINPSYHWKVIETSHFIIIYPEGFEDIAEEASIIAEDVHKSLVKFIKPSSTDKTAIVLLDNSDFANGLTNPLDKSIRIWLVNPNELEIGSKFDSWLRLVITHEYMHILHLDQVRGTSKIFRDIFGRIILPNQFLPYWMIEGYTVYAETYYASGGRANDTLFDMYLREMYRNNKLLEPDQVSSYDSLNSWPLGSAVYLYGGSIFEYIAKKYGEDKLKRISELTSSYIPVLMGPDLAIKEVLGIDYKTLWREWKDYIGARYDKQIEEVKKEGITDTKRLTRWGYRTSSPIVSSDGAFVLYSFSNPYYMPGLRMLELGDGKDTFLIKGEVYGKPAISLDRRYAIYSKIDYTDIFNLYLDLYRLDLGNKTEERLTKGLRAYNPVFLSENTILFLRRDSGRVDIGMMKLDSNSVSTFLSFSRDTQVKSMSISPDRKFLALSIWKEGGYQDIYLIDLEKKTLTQVTSDKATDGSPEFSRDGRYIIFSSDRSGIYNLYAYDIQEKKFYRVTNLFGGAFEPTISEDKIIFIGYSYEGYDVYAVEYMPNMWKEVEIKREEIPEITKEIKLSYTSRDYRSLDYILPRFWIPLPFGFLTYGQDYLELNTYFITFLYDISNRVPVFSFDYSRRLYNFSLNLNINYDGDNDTEMLYLSLPLKVSLFDVENLYVGLTRTKSNDINYSLFGQWNYSNIDGNDYFILRRDALLYTELSLDPNTSAVATIGSWKGKIGRPGSLQPSLGLNLTLGVSNIPDCFSLGGENETFALHGYEAGVDRGSTAFVGSIWLEKPITSIYRGLKLGEVFLEDVKAKLYLESGIAGNDIYTARLRGCVGGELSVSTSIEYGMVPLRLGLGVSKPLESEYPAKIYIILEGGF